MDRLRGRGRDWSKRAKCLKIVLWLIEDVWLSDRLFCRQRAMKKERKRRRVNDMVAQNWRIVETQITKGVRKKRKSIQRTTTLTRTCLTKKNTAVSNGRNEMKDTGKIEAIEMTEKTEDQRRNHGATKRNLSVLRIMIATVTEILSGTFTYEFTFKVNLEILSRKCVWLTVLFGDLSCPVHQ